jgi:hypothetical protein
MSGLHVGKKSVLLRLVEAMDLIDEYDCPRAGAPFALGASHHVLDLLDAGQHRAEGNKFRTGQPGDEPRKRSLPATGRSPEQHRSEVIILNLHPQRFSGTQQFFLADEFIQGARTHALSKRLMRQRHIRVNGLRQF